MRGSIRLHIFNVYTQIHMYMQYGLQCFFFFFFFSCSLPGAVDVENVSMCSRRITFLFLGKVWDGFWLYSHQCHYAYRSYSVSIPCQVFFVKEKSTCAGFLLSRGRLYSLFFGFSSWNKKSAQPAFLVAVFHFIQCLPLGCPYLLSPSSECFWRVLCSTKGMYIREPTPRAADKYICICDIIHRNPCLLHICPPGWMQPSRCLYGHVTQSLV